MKTVLRTFALLLLISFGFAAKAQVNITSGLSPDELAAYITGGGVNVFNVTYNCPDFSQGKFQVVESNLGLDSGIIITNGRAATAPGGPYYHPPYYCSFDTTIMFPIADSLGANGPSAPYSDDLFVCMGLGPSTVIGTETDHISDYDVDTLMIHPGLGEYNTWDACKLEFDFMAAGDSVSFDYVYGSSAYNAFPCSPADPFAAFLLGPGIIGKKNMATVPGTDYPICVATIQDPVAILAYMPDGTGPDDSVSCIITGGYPQFPEYYVDNYMGETVTYGGFSTVLTAKAAVTPCDTYHLKIVIADVGGNLYDSGVFIKAGSFSAHTGQLFAAGSAGLHTADTAIALAGCSPASFTFHTAFTEPEPITYYVSYSGTAIAGTDYATPLPTSFELPAGETSFSWPLTALYGGAFSSTLTATIADSTDAFCFSGPPRLYSATVLLIDSLPLAITTPDTALCLPACITPLTNTFPADSQLFFFWTPAAGVASPFSKNTAICPPASDTAITYTLHAFIPGASCDTSTATVTILPVSRPTVSASVPSGAATTCLDAPLPLSVTATPAYQGYRYSWQPAAYLDNDTLSDPSFIYNSAAGSYTLFVTATPLTNYGEITSCAATDSLTITVLPIGLSLLTPDTAICLGDSVQVSAIGSGELSYLWQPATDTTLSGHTIPNPVITPTVPGFVTYTLTASYPNCPDIIKSFTLETDPFPIEVQIPEDTLVCREDKIRISSVVTAGAFPYQYTWSGERPSGVPYPLGADSAITFEALQDTRLWLRVATPAGCYGADTMVVSVQDCCHLNVASGFTPNGDGKNDELSIVAQSGASVEFFRVYSRRGTLVYEQKGKEGGWDGTYRGEPQDVGVYMYVIRYRCPGSTEDKIYKGDVTLVR